MSNVQCLMGKLPSGSPGYEPLTLGMQAALPHLSVFAPAHNLASLRALGRYLQ